jgi:hypothetical protein
MDGKPQTLIYKKEPTAKPENYTRTPKPWSQTRKIIPNKRKPLPQTLKITPNNPNPNKSYQNNSSKKKKMKQIFLFS